MTSNSASGQIFPLPGNQNASFMLRVFSGEGYDLQGKIEHMGSGQYQVFQSAGEMMRLIHGKLEESGLPQAGCILRTWQ